jgi:hypothetical protein
MVGHFGVLDLAPERRGKLLKASESAISRVTIP